MKNNNKWLIGLVVMIACILAGCSSEPSDKESKKQEDGLKSALQKSEASSSYQIDRERFGKDLLISNSVLSIKDTKVQATDMIQKQDQVSYVYNKNTFTDLKINYLHVYRKDSHNQIMLMPLQGSEEQQLFQSYNKNEASSYNSSFSDLLNYVDNGIYASYFKISEKKEDKNTRYTLTCTDTKGWMDAVTKEEKKKDSSYDPLNYQGQKLEKREYKECNMELVVNEDGYIHEYIHHLSTDYGNDLVSDMRTTRTYSKYNETLLNTSFVDELCKKAGNNEYQQNDTIDTKELLS